MTVYIVVYFVILFLNVVFRSKGLRKKTKNSQKTYLVVSCLILTVLMAIREPHLGSDSWMYGTLYIRIGQANNFIEAMAASTFTAPLYVLVCRILFRISDSRQMLIIASAIAVNLSYYNFIKRESKDYVTSLLLFMNLAFYFQSYNGTRQYISIGLVLNAFSYWDENKKNIKGWVFFVSAVLVHPTAIIGAVFLILVGHKNENKEKALTRGILVAVISGLSETVLLTVFIRLFPQYGSYFDASFGHYYYDTSAEGRQVLVVLVYFAIVVYTIIILRRSKRNTMEESVTKFLSPMIIAVVVGFLGVNSWALSRVNFFFTNLSICFIPNVFCLKINRYKNVNRFLKVLTIVVTAVYGFIYLYEDKAGIIPYSVFW